MKKASSGNALFLVLIGIVLFGALSFAVTKSFRGGEKTATDEQLRVAATDMLRYLSSVQQAVNKLITVNGCSESEVSFENTLVLNGSNAVVYPANYVTTPADGRCKVFESAGGGLSPRLFDRTAGLTNPSAALASQPKPGHFQARTTEQFVNVGSALPEMSMRIMYVSAGLCAAINKILNIPGNGDYLPIGNGDDSIITNDTPGLAGKKTLCTRRYGTGEEYFVWNVLIAR